MYREVNHINTTQNKPITYFNHQKLLKIQTSEEKDKKNLHKICQVRSLWRERFQDKQRAKT